MVQLARDVYNSPIAEIEFEQSLQHHPSSLRVVSVVLQLISCHCRWWSRLLVVIALLRQRAADISRSQLLDTKLQLCCTMQYHALLCLTSLLLNLPYPVLMIQPYRPE